MASWYLQESTAVMAFFRKPNLHHANMILDEHAFDIPHPLRFKLISLTPFLAFPHPLRHWEFLKGDDENGV